MWFRVSGLEPPPFNPEEGLAIHGTKVIGSTQGQESSEKVGAWRTVEGDQTEPFSPMKLSRWVRAEPEGLGFRVLGLGSRVEGLMSGV